MNQLCLTRVTLDSLTTDKAVALGFQIELEFGWFFLVGWLLIFVEGGKPENPEKNPRSKDENQQQTQPTYDVESGESNPGHIGERRVLSPLCHPCSHRYI